MFKESKKILMITGDCAEDYEVWGSHQCLEAFGFEVVSVCPGKKKGDITRTAVHDFEGHQTYTEKQGHNYILNGNFDEINPDTFAGLTLPGGRQCEYLRNNEQVLKVIKHFVNAQKPISAICHGIQLLIPQELNCLKGVNVTCYPACIQEVKLAGGIFIDVGINGVQVDKNFVTAQAWPGLSKYIKEFAALLGTKITHS